ncbi:MAG: iron-containing alcohol dehydrogenase [Chitinophagaceae bacterium]|nr:iron-containing alcohol dehydrogenase [Chitinophagaceae bacterium]
MQKLLQGKNTIYEAAPYLIEAGYETVFLITGKHFQLHGNPEFLKGIHYNHFIKDGVNVTESETNEAVTEFSKEKFQAILAIGGGSVIDLAKSLIYQLEKESKYIPFLRLRLQPLALVLKLLILPLYILIIRNCLWSVKYCCHNW